MDFSLSVVVLGGEKVIGVVLVILGITLGVGVWVFDFLIDYQISKNFKYFSEIWFLNFFSYRFN
ncbi:hypothetical protein JQN64_24720 [Escherichia coli]|nr:hypothetical protein [Escherichia coli]